MKVKCNIIIMYNMTEPCSQVNEANMTQLQFTLLIIWGTKDSVNPIVYKEFEANKQGSNEMKDGQTQQTRVKCNERRSNAKKEG